MNLTCASLLTGSGSGDEASVKWVALTVFEGDGGKDQLESLTMCVDMSNNIHDCMFCLRSVENRSMYVARVMFES